MDYKLFNDILSWSVGRGFYLHFNITRAFHKGAVRERGLIKVTCQNLPDEFFCEVLFFLITLQL